MENTKITRDNFEVEFAESEDFLSFLDEREKNAEWIDEVPISEITFTPIMPIESLALSNALGVSLEAAVDTASEGSRMLMELPDGRKFLMRENAWAQAKQRIIGGEGGFNRLPIEKQMEVLRIYQDHPPKHPALIRYGDEKASAFLASGLYTIVPAAEVFRTACELVEKDLSGASFDWGVFTHTGSYCEYIFDRKNPMMKSLIQRYEDITGKEHDLIMRISTSDTGNSAVTVAPWLISKGGTHIPLGAPLFFPHKGEKTIENLKENISQFTESVRRGADRLEELSKIKIEYGGPTMIHAMRRVQLPAKYGMPTVQKFVAAYKDCDVTALDIFMVSNDIPAMIRLQEKDSQKALRAEDACARMLGIHNWDAMDYPSDLVWTNNN